MRLRGLVDGCDRSLDPVRRLVRVARNLVVDEDGVPVRGDGVHVSVRADDVLDVVDVSQAPLDVGHHGPELGCVGLERLALDEDRLVGLLREGVVDGFVSPSGLADS